MPSLFSKSRRRDDQGDSTDDGDDKGVEASPREAPAIHCLPTGSGRGFKSSQASASPAGAAAAPAASPTRGEAPAAEEATTPVGPKLIRSKGKIEIMGFEVANVIVRAINLRQSLLERDIEDLRAEVLASEGIRMLVSDDFYHVWCIAAEDKRGELRAVARDVARLGKQCLDPALHSLTQAFDALGTMDGPKGRMTSAEVEGELRALEGQAQITAVSWLDAELTLGATGCSLHSSRGGGGGGVASFGRAGADHSAEVEGELRALEGQAQVTAVSGWVDSVLTRELGLPLVTYQLTLGVTRGLLPWVATPLSACGGRGGVASAGRAGADHSGEWADAVVTPVVAPLAAYEQTHGLTRRSHPIPWVAIRIAAAEVEGGLRALEGQAQVTAELYHELANLEQLQQSSGDSRSSYPLPVLLSPFSPPSFHCPTPSGAVPRAGESGTAAAVEWRFTFLLSPPCSPFPLFSPILPLPHPIRSCTTSWRIWNSCSSRVAIHVPLIPSLFSFPPFLPHPSTAPPHQELYHELANLEQLQQSSGDSRSSYPLPVLLSPFLPHPSTAPPHQELYHELANLEQLQQSLDRRMKQDSDSAINRELIAQMRAEMKAQEKIVKTMKKKGLWSKTMDEVVEKLVQVVIFLHDQIVDVFGADVVKVGRLMSGTLPTAADLRKLGVNGMALQYANIVNMIDTMVMRPACVETQREALFSALPASVCGRLKRTLLQSQDIEQESTESIRQKMEAVLDWLVTMAENTIRFGLDSRVQGHTDLTLLQTLQHVDHLKMERLVLLLLVGLQHLASRSADHDWSPVPRGVVLAPVYSPRVLSPDRAGSSAAGGGVSAAGGGDGIGVVGDGAETAAAAGESDGLVVRANGEKTGEMGEKIITVETASAKAGAAATDAGTAAANIAPAAGLLAASEEAIACATDEFRFPLSKSSSVEAQGPETEGAAAAAAGAAAAGGAAGAAGAAGTAAAAEAEPAVVPPISLSLARRSLSESVPTVGDWETLPRRIAAMEEEEKARAEEGSVDSAAEGLGSGETGRPRSAGLEAGAVDAAGSAEPPVWRQVRQASLSEVSLEPVPEVEVMEGEEGEEEGEGEKGAREEGEEEVHEKEKDDLLAPLASKTGGGGGSRPSSSGGKLVPTATATAAAAVGASTGEDAESPAAAARRALASGMGTSRKSLENALRMGGNAGKRPVDAAGAFGSPFDRTKPPGSAAGSGPLAGEALLAAMTMSQGFGPAARGAASEEMMEAMREATYGRSRSHTFAMAARPEPNPRFFTKSLSRYSLLRRMEAEEAGGGGGGGGAGSSSSGGGSVFVAPQRFLPMTPATVDVDRIHDVQPDLDLSSVAAPRLGGRLL
ncbi:unnamed protein product [Closterium sp. Naga37s-1]|nr:unnamed protein product [Closterium sp. Naga37s-1]